MESSRGCGITIARPTALPSGQCIELTRLVVGQACPVGFNTVLPVEFEITAKTAKAGLRWRRSPNTGDVLIPTEGAIGGNAITGVSLSDVVLDSSLKIEIMDGDAVLLRFTLKHQ